MPGLFSRMSREQKAAHKRLVELQCLKEKGKASTAEITAQKKLIAALEKK